MCERIEEIKDFYGSGLVTSANLIVEELKSSDLLSVDVKGKWCVEQLENAARTLHLMPFILALDKGGVLVPEIRSREEYVKVYTDMSAHVVNGLEVTFEFREKRKARVYAELQQLDAELERWERLELPVEAPVDPDAVKEWKAAVKEKANKIAEFKGRSEEAYGKWHAIHSELEKDKQRVEDNLEKAVKKAEKQRQEDNDAVTRVLRACDSLKKFLQGLMTRVPEIVQTVRKMGPHHVDPYTAGNLRVIYANLVERFRNGDEMGVTTTLIGGMRLVQGLKQSLSEFVRMVEEFHQHLVVLGVKEVSVSDLAAVVALGGMHEVHKMAFLENETTVALTVKNLEGEEELGASDGTVVSRRGDKRSLLEKVLDFSNGVETKKHLVGNLSGGGNKVDKGVTDLEAQALKRREAEIKAAQMHASRVLTVQDGVKLSDEERLKNGVCYRFADKRGCGFGEFCKFAHVEGKKESKKEGDNVDVKKPGASVRYTSLFDYDDSESEED